MLGKNVLNKNMDIYTPIEEAGEIIRERWSNKSLKEAVEKNLNKDFPEILKSGPHGLIWRQIGTPDGEFERFINLCKQANIKPICFEYTQDKFHAGNFTKYGLVNLHFFDHKTNYGTITYKEKIIDFNKAEQYKLSELKTLWNENLVDFHHFFLTTIFPIMCDSVVDMSTWFKSHGAKPSEYYEYLLSFAVCHTVYFEDYDLLDSERGFIDEIVLPAFNKVEKKFGFKPIIVKISKIGEHEKDPFWWCYSKKSRDIMREHINELKK
jgi:hypothetical protein